VEFCFCRVFCCGSFNDDDDDDDDDDIDDDDIDDGNDDDVLSEAVAGIVFRVTSRARFGLGRMRESIWL